MSRALLQKRINVLVAATDANGRGRLTVDLGRPMVYSGTPAIFFRHQWHDGFQYSWPYARWLHRHLAEFDLVHIHLVFSFPCMVAARASRRLGVPYVVSPQGTLDPWSLRQKRLRKRVVWQLEGGRMLRRAAAVHYATAEEQKRAEGSLGLSRGVVVPLIVDDDVRSIPVIAEQFRHHHVGVRRDPYILVLSRLHPKKGLELLLRVFLAVTRDHEFERWRLVIGGDGTPGYSQQLKRQVAAAPGGNRVLFTGWLEGNDRIAAIQGAALLVMPSSQENFGLAVAEAMACGVPVLVSTDVNLGPDIRAVGAGWVVAREPAALAATLREALRSEDERARRGAAGKLLALTRFSSEVVGTQLLDLYASIAR